jgi:hypothetical protein
VAHSEVRGGPPEGLRRRSGKGQEGAGAYLHFYNNQRPHQALSYQTPAQVFFGHLGAVGEGISCRRWPEEPMLVIDPATGELSLKSAPFLSN